MATTAVSDEMLSIQTEVLHGNSCKSVATVSISLEALHGNSCSVSCNGFYPTGGPRPQMAIAAVAVAMVSILQEAREAPNGNSCSGSCNSFYPLEARGPVWQYCSWKWEDERRAPCLDEWWCNYRVGTDLGSLLIRVGCRIRAGIVKFCPKSSECLGGGGHQRSEDSPVSWWCTKLRWMGTNHSQKFDIKFFAARHSSSYSSGV